MPYEIDFDRPLGDEVRRIGAELLTDAIDLLQKKPNGPHEAIHDARKNIKRVRALYRLVRSEIPDFAAEENARLRNIAQELSHFRDAAALVETTDYLELQTDAKPAKSAVRHLGKLMKQRRDSIAKDEEELGQTLSVCCTRLGAAATALEKLRMPILRKQATHCLATGWGKTSKKARIALLSCHDARDEEPFHDLRKRAQDRFMHAALLRGAWPSGMISIQRQAKALVGVLGHEHDLAVLQGQLESHIELSEQQHAHSLGAIAAERASLQKAAREAGEDIFIDGHKHDARIVALLIRKRF